MSDRRGASEQPSGSLSIDDSDERVVVGSLLAFPEETAAHFSDQLRPDLFFGPVGRLAYAAISSLWAKTAPISVITATQELREQGELENIGGPAVVTDLQTKFAPAKLSSMPAQVEYALANLRAAAARRQVVAACRELAELSGNPTTDPAEIVGVLFRQAEQIRELQNINRIFAPTLGELKRAPANGDDVLLGSNGYLRRGGGALVVGPTGIGKSSAGMQAATSWSLGKAFFGIPAVRPLRSLIIQAENDDIDMAEMRDGVFDGMGLTAAERQRAEEMVRCFHENSRSGEDFFARTVEPLLRLYSPDLLWIDPALSYIAGESNSQADVGRFLRNWLNPLLTRYRCAAIVTHHTNKPPTGKEKTEWSGSDLAYLGSGSAEWANWARAVIAIRSLGENGIFELCLGKRGGRVGWRNEAGEPIYSKTIAHAKEPGRIYWREADESERPNGEKKTGRPKVFGTEKLLQILGDGSKLISEWWKDAEAQMWSHPTFKRRVAELKDDKRIIQSPLDGSYSRRISP